MATIWDQAYGATAPRQTTPGDSNVFYNPTSNYGADRDWNKTPLVGTIREQNPQLAYAQYGQRMGIADNDNAFNRWFYQQYPRFQNAHGLAVLNNPLMTMDQFMSTLPGMNAIRAQFQQMSPQARGLNYSSFAPQVRTIGR